jgi:hypothetical protein
MTPHFPVCRKCHVAPLMDIGFIWECPRCGLRITTAAVRFDSAPARARERANGHRR